MDDRQESEEQSDKARCPLHGLSPVTIDIVSGICAGITATFVAHPLDTVKVRFQTQLVSDNITIRQCMSDIYLREGVSFNIALNRIIRS